MMLKSWFAQQHSVANMNVGAGGIDAKLDAELALAL
jgi:hypothetical protein